MLVGAYKVNPQKVSYRWSRKGDRSKGVEVLEVKRCEFTMCSPHVVVCNLVGIGNGVCSGSSNQAYN